MGLDSSPGQPGHGTYCCAGRLQHVQSCSMVANGAALKGSFDVDIQSWLYSSYSVYETLLPPQGLKEMSNTEIWEALAAPAGCCSTVWLV